MKFLLFTFLFNRLFYLSFFLLLPLTVIADVTIDGTLTENPQYQNSYTLDGTQVKITKDMGEETGANLFFSFSKFNIDVGQTVTYDLLGHDNIHNVINRVTGDNKSIIDGKLSVQSNHDVNFFFLNPFGISFGENASVDINGSLYFSTANYLSFEDGKEFSTTTDNKILSTALPEKFGFLSSPKNIDLNKANLSLKDNTSLSLIGGDINITNTDVKIPNGHFNLISLSDVPYEVDIGFQNIDTTKMLGEINIENTDFSDEENNRINVSGELGGNIYIRGETLVLSNTDLDANTEIKESSSNLFDRDTEINIEAKTIKLLNSSRITTELKNEHETFSSVKGGDINLKANSLVLLSDEIIPNSQTLLVNRTIGNKTTGQLGDINISANKVDMVNASIDSTTTGKVGAGNINIKTDNLSLRGAVKLDVSVGGTQETETENAGNIVIQGYSEEFVDSIVMEANAENILDQPYILSNMSSAGKGGNIEIKAKQMSMKNAAIEAGILKFAQGDSGQIKLEITDSLTLKDNASITSKTVSEYGENPAGDIDINARNLSLSSNASITSTTTGSGNAGAINLHGIQNLDIDSAKVSTETNSKANAGQINIAAQNILLRNNSFITSKSDHSEIVKQANLNILPPLGNAGSINLTIGNSLKLFSGSSITTSAKDADGGNINIESAGYLLFGDNSSMKVNVKDIGDGGNINIDSNFMIFLDNNKINADAGRGKGGNIKVYTTSLYSNFAGNYHNYNNRFTASSGVGLDGTVDIVSKEYLYLNFSLLPYTNPESTLNICEPYLYTKSGETSGEKSSALSKADDRLLSRLVFPHEMRFPTMLMPACNLNQVQLSP